MVQICICINSIKKITIEDMKLIIKNKIKNTGNLSGQILSQMGKDCDDSSFFPIILFSEAYANWNRGQNYLINYPI